MIFRQLHDPRCGMLSYLIADPVTREAAAVDARAGTAAELVAAVRALGLTLKYFLETHTHPDEEVELEALRRQGLRARVVRHECAPLAADIRVRDGDVLYIGEEAIEVLHTPGHTPCSVTYAWNDRLFTGHTLLVADVGSAAHAQARVLYDSIVERLYRLPGERLIYPSGETEGRRVSSVAQERATNRRLPLGRACDEFVAAHALREDHPQPFDHTRKQP